MPNKVILSLFITVLFGFAAFPSYSQDIISCNGFESCPAADTSALEARIAALEALLAGATRGIDPSTSQDSLTFDNSTSSKTVVVRDLSTTGKHVIIKIQPGCWSSFCCSNSMNKSQNS